MTTAYRIKSNVKGFSLFTLIFRFSILSASLMSGYLNIPSLSYVPHGIPKLKIRSDGITLPRFSRSFLTESRIAFELLTVSHMALSFLPVL